MSICENTPSKSQNRRRLTNEIVDERLTDRNIVRIGQIVNSSTKVEWQCCKCNHIWQATPNKLLTGGGTGCPNCSHRISLTSEIVDARLTNQHRNIMRIGQVVKTHNKIDWQCGECNYIWSATPNNILDKESGCPQCSNSIPLTNETVDIRVNNKKLTLFRVGQVVNSSTKMEWQCCNCDHLWWATPNSILDSGTGCPCCNNRLPLTNNIVDVRLIDKNRNLIRVGNTIDALTRIEWQCTLCNNNWVATPNSVLNCYTGCPVCNKSGMMSASYFRANPHERTSTGILYLVQGLASNGTQFVKVGITKKTVISRFAGDAEYHIRELASKKMPLYEAFMIEQAILTKHAKHRKHPDNRFIGKTECMVYEESLIGDILSEYF